tara:strand:- start:143 stop:844 length:702 start_codon:yes stop_codon:yes gene_type:complete
LISKKIFLVTCPSNETLEYIKSTNIFEKKIVNLLYDPIINVSVIHNNLKEKIDNMNLKKNYFISIGRLTKQKNHILLIKLFEIKLKEKKNLFLYILGDGEEKLNILKEIKKLHLENNIFLLGYIKNVYPYIAGAQAVISPSLWEDPGAVMIESGFCNKVVISSDCISGPKEFLMHGEAGYLFRNNNLSSFNKTIDNFLQDTRINISSKKIKIKRNTKKYTMFSHYNHLNMLLG